MTPSAIRLVSQLRHEFYSLFAAAMKVQVHITNGKSYTSNLSMASWTDSRHRLNYLYVYAHTAPDELVPERPLVLRLAINKGAGTVANSKRGKGEPGLNQNWHFELTLLPEEILDFLPWLVSLVKSYDNGAAPFIPEPPHPFDFTTSDVLLFQDAQTHEASHKLAQQVMSS
jgi:hypothetical protein